MIDPLYAFVFLGLFSPGPNVILLTASGARFGFRRTLPHLLGVAIGVGITAGVTGFGIGAALETAPRLRFALQVIAALWILYMAWRLWMSSPNSGDGNERPMTFVEAVLFQWVNPKVWAVALAAAGGFSIGLPPMQEALRLGTAFSATNLGVCLFWTAAGTLLAFLLQSPKAWRMFNRTMAAALAAFAVLMFI